MKISPGATAILCAHLYPCPEDALAVVLKLRRAGWRVPLFDTPVGPRADGGFVIAVVYHPRSAEQFGELRYRNGK